MTITSDWVIYYIRSMGECTELSNSVLGTRIKKVLGEMGCPMNPKGIPKPSPLYRKMHAELAKEDFARTGMVYEIEIDRLPLFFTKIGKEFGIKIS